MPTIRRNATTTIASGWTDRVPAVAAHLNIDEDVASPNEADYVGASADQTNEYGGFFTAGDVPAGSTINSLSVRQHSMNLTTQYPRSTRFALKVNGVEVSSAIYDVTNAAPGPQYITFSTPPIAWDELPVLSVKKTTIGGSASTNDPPVPEGMP